MSTSMLKRPTNKIETIIQYRIDQKKKANINRRPTKAKIKIKR